MRDHIHALRREFLELDARRDALLHADTDLPEDELQRYFSLPALIRDLESQ